MRRMVLAIVAAVAAAPASAVASPLGNWARLDGNAMVRIEACGDALCAVNTWIRDTSNGEEVGHRLVMRVRDDGAGRYSGTAFDPQRNRTYGFNMTVRGNFMRTQGCMLAVLCKSMDWNKIP